MKDIFIEQFFVLINPAEDLSLLILQSTKKF